MVGISGSDMCSRTNECAEIGEYWDAGTTTFYLADFWSLWDLFVIGIGFAFFVARKLHGL
jgi:hypothetical protein